MIRQVGLFKFLKNNYDSDEDLKDLEELVYEDENGFRNKRSINDMIHSYQVGSYTGSNHNDDLEEELYKTAGSDASACCFLVFSVSPLDSSADASPPAVLYNSSSRSSL